MSESRDFDWSFEWVATPQQLARMAEAVAEARELALDSESNSGFVFRERLCLLQLHAAGRNWLIDLLALPGGRRALEPLRDLLEDPSRRVLLHGGEFDVGCLKRDYDLHLGGVWDTQQAASYLGWTRTGYGAVVQRVCDVELPKAYTRYDWSRRPLPREVLRYAVQDVLYLPPVAAALRRWVRSADLEEEVAIAFQAVESASWNGGFRPGAVWEIRGARVLPETSKGVLVALYAWRERVAQRLDLPPGRAIHNQVLLALSRRPPTRPSQLRRLGVPRRITERWSDELLRLVGDARRNPPPLPAFPARGSIDRQAQRRGARLKQWRRREAQRRGVPLQVVLPLASLKYLQQHGAGDLVAVPQLGDKRIRLYGDQLRRLA